MRRNGRRSQHVIEAALAHSFHKLSRSLSLSLPMATCNALHCTALHTSCHCYLRKTIARHRARARPPRRPPSPASTDVCAFGFAQSAHSLGFERASEHQHCTSSQIEIDRAHSARAHVCMFRCSYINQIAQTNRASYVDCSATSAHRQLNSKRPYLSEQTKRASKQASKQTNKRTNNLNLDTSLI